MAEGEGNRKLGVLCQHKILLMKLKENLVHMTMLVSLGCPCNTLE